MKLINRGVIIVKPTQVFLDWLNQISLNEPDPTEFTLEEIQDDCTTFLIPDLVNVDSLNYILEPMKTSIFESELSDWFTDPALWPVERSAKEFDRWFSLEYHSMVWDMLDNPIQSIDEDEELADFVDESGADVQDEISLDMDDDFSVGTPFKRQDSVVVRQGAVEQGRKHNGIGGWQGRIIDFMRSKDGNILALIEWDSQTLEQMSDRFIEEHSDQAWEWEALVIDTDCLVKTVPRDSYYRVERMQARLAAKFFWPFIADGGASIASILKDIDLDEDASILHVWQAHLSQNLVFPFEACLERPDPAQGLKKGDFVTVQSLSSIDLINGIQARVLFKKHLIDIPFSNLIILNESSSNYKIIENYKLWFDYTL